MRLAGGTAMVTGASRGIGREFARSIHPGVARDALVARSRHGLEGTAYLLGRPNRQILAPTCNMKRWSRNSEHPFGPQSITLDPAGRWARREALRLCDQQKALPAEMAKFGGIRRPVGSLLRTTHTPNWRGAASAQTGSCPRGLF